jgi:hypothetical protein
MYTTHAGRFPNASPETKDAIEIVCNLVGDIKDQEIIPSNEDLQKISARMILTLFVCDNLLRKEIPRLTKHECLEGMRGLAAAAMLLRDHFRLWPTVVQKSSVELLIGTPES